MVKQHLLRAGEGGLGLLGGPRVQLVLVDEAQLLHKVLLADPAVDQLLQLFPVMRLWNRATRGQQKAAVVQRLQTWI